MSRTLLLLCLALQSLQVDVRSQAFRLAINGERGIAWDAEIASQEEFVVSFIHSSERCRWTHRYRAAAAHHIEQLDSQFTCVGPGMPSLAAGSVSSTGDGYQVPARMDLGDIFMLAWAPSDIVLTLREHSVHISRWLGNYEPFAIQVRSNKLSHRCPPHDSGAGELHHAEVVPDVVKRTGFVGDRIR
ncbi:MAG: hypothetical protein AB7H93_20635 [Vicinamibacterales bacterium]